MDFTFDEQQQALRDLAVQILGDRATVDAHKALEARGEWFDRGTWKAFAEAGLLGIPVPEAKGGLGLGFMEIAVVCTEIGRTVAKLPFLGNAVAASALATFGPASLGDAWLPEVADGTAVLAVAVADPAGAAAVKASADGRLDGQVSFVPGGLWADLVLVAATGSDGRAGGGRRGTGRRGRHRRAPGHVVGPRGAASRSRAPRPSSWRAGGGAGGWWGR